ncbi:MAG: hypothetical protein A3H97_11145 [Acidobacteria bacterium RIFCSPLOWO2_02_FULL_65_29]|nr:MAG: hypothetical protein A3H97_11145 [Acidobacteria bacterium RIFCSPLOWO2_02_FULL_65_29]
MDDVLVVGAGPAGSVAATVLARAGAKVRLVDRVSFPRDKLCGDTLNAGTLAILARLRLASPVELRSRPLDGMMVTGEGGVAVEGRYPNGLHAIAISRRVMDEILLQEAIHAGVTFEPGITVQGASVAGDRGERMVVGVTASSRGSVHPWRARVVVGADGRRSALAFGLGLAAHPAAPRRWAIGAYFEEPDAAATLGARPSHAPRAPRACSDFSDTLLGEMHIRRGRYIGVAPLPGGVANVCLVKPSGPGDPDLRNPEAALRRELGADPLLRDRYSTARLVRPAIVLGPVAVDAGGGAIDGLILAGDAAGFIDPMTGDGLRFAVRGGEMAATAALDALEHGWTGVHARLTAERRREFGAKWRFNLVLRTAVAWPVLVRAAAVGARVLPAAVRAMIEYAGDCGVARATMMES